MIEAPMPAPSRPGEVAPPPDFLRGQMRHWMEQVVAAGKTRDLFELEMWLRSFERFFRIKNQPLSEKETQAARPPQLVGGAAARRQRDPARRCSSAPRILTEDQVNLTRFDKYVEGYLKKDDAVDPYVEKLLRQSTPGGGPHPAARVARGPAPRPHGPDAALAHPLRDLHRGGEDRSTARSGAATCWPCSSTRSSSPSTTASRTRPSPPSSAASRTRCERKQAAKVFLEFFRLLHYLEFADPEHTAEESLKNTILVFSLITSETRLLLAYLERRVLKGADARGRRSTSSTTRSCTACPSS